METINCRYVFIHISNPGKGEMGIIVLQKGLGGPKTIFTIAVPVREVNFKRDHIMLGLTGSWHHLVPSSCHWILTSSPEVITWSLLKHTQ